MLSDRLRQIATSFGRKAEIYDRHAVLQKEIAARLAEFLPDSEAPDILEIGCGTGFVTGHILDAYPDGRFLVTDIAQGMLSVAEKKFARRGVEFAVMDGQSPVAGRKFDLVVIGMAAQWFDEPLLRLASLREILRPGGQILFSVPGDASFSAWKDVLQESGLEDGLLSYPAWPGVVRRDAMAVDYGRVENFLKSLKDIGAHQPREGYAALHPAALRKACRLYNERHKGVVTWDIVYGRLYAAC